MREGAADALAGREDERVFDALVELTADPEPGIRDWATFALGTLSPQDTPTLRDALAARLDDSDDSTRIEAVHGLALRGDARALDAALDLLGEVGPHDDGGNAADTIWKRYALTQATVRLAALTGDARLKEHLPALDERLMGTAIEGDLRTAYDRVGGGSAAPAQPRPAGRGRRRLTAAPSARAVVRRAGVATRRPRPESGPRRLRAGVATRPAGAAAGCASAASAAGAASPGAERSGWSRAARSGPWMLRPSSDRVLVGVSGRASVGRACSGVVGGRTGPGVGADGAGASSGSGRGVVVGRSGRAGLVACRGRRRRGGRASGAGAGVGGGIGGRVGRRRGAGVAAVVLDVVGGVRRHGRGRVFDHDRRHVLARAGVGARGLLDDVGGAVAVGVVQAVVDAVAVGVGAARDRRPASISTELRRPSRSVSSSPSATPLRSLSARVGAVRVRDLGAVVEAVAVEVLGGVGGVVGSRP